MQIARIIRKWFRQQDDFAALGEQLRRLHAGEIGLKNDGKSVLAHLQAADVLESLLEQVAAKTTAADLINGAPR